jgi:ferric enterobactin receptor
MYKLIYSLFLSVIVVFSLPAQSGNKPTAIIFGQVIDGQTEDPMIAATVTITDRETGSILTGARTDSEGEFEIQDIPYGVYDIGVSFIGYEEVRIDSVELGDDQTEFSLSITLLPSEISLAEVTIVSDRPVIENRFDKIVYNVSSDITSRGTVAIDVLRKVPHVTVDADGNVELQGNSNVRFLINGRTSSIFGSNLADALASIPASQIRSIEAITNPGAKYDLQGTGGVINIIMDNNRLQGLSGSVNLSAGTRNQTGSVNLGIKRGNFGVSGYFSGNSRMGTDASFSSVRETTDPLSGLSTSLVQSGLNTVSRNGYRAGTGFEWDISRRLSMSGSVGYNNFSFGTRGSAGT